MAKKFELQACHFIDSHKCASVVWILFCIFYHGAWHNTAACLYLATHGLYGLLWTLKSHVFPDKRWFTPAGPGVAIITWSLLTGYWFSPWYAPMSLPLLCLPSFISPVPSRANWLRFMCSYRIIARDNVQPPPLYLACCVALFSSGVFFHFVSDMQKHVHLQLRPGKLLNDGLWARCRNPKLFWRAFDLCRLHCSEHALGVYGIPGACSFGGLGAR